MLPSQNNVLNFFDAFTLGIWLAMATASMQLGDHV